MLVRVPKDQALVRFGLVTPVLPKDRRYDEGISAGSSDLKTNGDFEGTALFPQTPSSA